MKRSFGIPLTGLFLGFALSYIGFNSWDEVHRMFTFEDLRLVLAFGVAVVSLGVLWRLTGSFIKPQVTPRLIHKGSLVGGLLFGIGWAVTGACPAIAFVQLGAGQLGALATIAGIFFGNWVYAIVHERYFTFPASSCSDD